MSEKVAGAKGYLLGLITVFVIACLARIGDPFIHGHWKFGADVLHLNYVLVAVIVGMAIRNTVGVPDALKPGIKLARPALKVGVVMMGALYSTTELTRLGLTSVIMVTASVIITAALVLWLAGIMKVDRTVAGLTACGAGVCGVSAVTAVAPVVRAGDEETACAAATMLIFGVAGLFLFPVIGGALHLTDTQFGAWAGTGILDSGQALGAALSFSPEAGKVGGIFSVVSAVWLPVVVVLAALWYARREAVEVRVPVNRILINKFPLFVLGFLILVTLRSTGVIGDDPAVSALKKDSDSVSAFIGLPGKEAEAVSAMMALKADMRSLAERGYISPDAAGVKDKLDAATQILIMRPIEPDEAESVRDGVRALSGMVSDDLYALRKVMGWFFAFGFAGIGLNTSLREMGRAGGRPFLLGSIAAGVKAVGSLIVVKLFL